MACALFLTLRHVVLYATFVILTLQVPPSTAQSAALVQSINCGGEAYTDANNTGIAWEGDPLNANDNEVSLFGKAGKVQNIPRSQNIPTVLKTLRSFPDSPANRKFCYELNISEGETYLLRASFLYDNYDGLNQPPSFVLIFNYDVWEDVNITSSTIPAVYELIFNSTGNDYVVCLAPRINSNHTPFISTLELRLLNSTMYDYNYGGVEGALRGGHGLRLWHRINYGATNSSAIRYPNDDYDRIWEANTTGPIDSTNISKISTVVTEEDPEGTPAEVMATAITTRNPKGNLSFTFEGFGGVAGFRLELHWQEVDEEAFSRDGARQFGVTFPHSGLRNSSSLAPAVFGPVVVPVGAPIALVIDQQLQLPLPLQITLFPNSAHSTRGPLLNAIELFRWTQYPLSATGTHQSDVDAIILIQSNFKLIGHGQGDPCLPNGYAWPWIKCNQDSSPKITEIHLANYSLKGEIPLSITHLTYLQKIDLSNNMLSGEIPDITQLQNLGYLDLHENNLSGLLPESLGFLKNLYYLNIAQNDLCGNTSSFQNLENFTFIGKPKLCNDTSSSSSSSTIVIKNCNTKKYVYTISFLGALYILSMLAGCLVYMAKHNKLKGKTSTVSSTKYKNGEKKLQGLPFTSKMFTYNEICNATLDFTTLIGEGGFGKVYRGQLPSGEAIAVKMLEDASKQGLKEFSTEVAILSSVRHKNLVSLIGYCMEDSYMLIYEYIAKGNLRDLIYGEIASTDKPLSWITRLQIALDACLGLEYLHTGCDPSIIHRDVKSSNILLSEKMQAKVSDFGLSRLKEGGSTASHVSTVNVVGTAGYLDPAYNATNQLTDKSDVYSFGVVLFELICGRAPIDMYSSPPHIVEWVTPAIVQGRVGDIVDPMLVNGYKADSMWKVIDVASGCVEHDRFQRPKMTQVAQVLREALEIETDPKISPTSQDVSGNSSSSDGKFPTLQYEESLRMRLQPR